MVKVPQSGNNKKTVTCIYNKQVKVICFKVVLAESYTIFQILIKKAVTITKALEFDDTNLVLLIY